LQRKSMAIRAAWWTEEADFSSNPVVPLLPETDSGSVKEEDAPPPPFPSSLTAGFSLDLSDADVSAPPQPLI